MALSHEDVKEILRIIDESDLDELRIDTEGFSLHVVRRGAAADARDPLTTPEPSDGAADRAPDRVADGELLTIPSPMLGTFYRAESPGGAPFVEVGAEVEPETTVCIIEVMKMMNSVPAGLVGTVVEVCPENGELVEYGAPLFRIRQR